VAKAATARRSHADRNRHGERGDTLIEILMTLIVLSIAVVALTIAFATGISASVDHKNLAANDVVLRQVEEQAFYLVQQKSSPLYASCASVAGGQYASLTVSSTYNRLPSGYSVSMNPILYWDTTTSPAQFDGTCAADSPQLISLTLAAPNGSIATTTFVVDDLGPAPPPGLTVTSVSPSSAIQGTSNLALSLSGTGFASNATVAFSDSGITVNSTTYVTPTLLDLNVSIATTASVGPSSITVTNPTTGTTASGPVFTVIQSITIGMHVSAMSSFDFFLPIWPIVEVQVEDGSNHLMSHVTVSGTWSPSNGGGITTSTCVTNASGTCYLLYGLFNFPSTAGSATYTIFGLGPPAGLVATGYTYTPASNTQSSITVNWP
jgi:type II secretory pathway pseudopilin PulG